MTRKGGGEASGVRLEDAVKGCEVSCRSGRPAFLVKTAVSRLKGAEEVGPAFHRAMVSRRTGLRRRLAALLGPAELRPEKTIFVDVESTGLGNSPLFLIGGMVWGKEGLEVRQFFARNYAEEAAVIASFAECFSGRTLLVTFNGKSFDMPYIRARAVANGVPFVHDPRHFDLLHECRRLWRDALPNCRLQTLETHVCGRVRSGDIPGDRIPDAYHEYVRSEDAAQIVEVLRHNMLDLVTLADLMTRLPEPDGQ